MLKNDQFDHSVLSLVVNSEIVTLFRQLAVLGTDLIILYLSGMSNASCIICVYTQSNYSSSCLWVHPSSNTLYVVLLSEGTEAAPLPQSGWEIA